MWRCTVQLKDSQEPAQNYEGEIVQATYFNHQGKLLVTEDGQMHAFNADDVQGITIYPVPES